MFAVGPEHVVTDVSQARKGTFDDQVLCISSNVFVLGIVDISLGFPGNVPKVIAAHFRFVETDSRYGEYAAGNGTKLSTNVSSEPVAVKSMVRFKSSTESMAHARVLGPP